MTLLMQNVGKYKKFSVIKPFLVAFDHFLSHKMWEGEFIGGGGIY